MQAENSALARQTMEEMRRRYLTFLLDDFGADMSAVARRMYLEPGKLPLIVIVDETMTGIYGVAGYNVGTADMILKLLQYSNRND